MNRESIILRLLNLRCAPGRVGSFKEQTIYKTQNSSVALEHLSALLWRLLTTLDITDWTPVALSSKDLMFFFTIHKQPVCEHRGGMSLTLFDQCSSSLKQVKLIMTSTDFYLTILKKGGYKIETLTNATNKMLINPRPEMRKLKPRGSIAEWRLTQDCLPITSIAWVPVSFLSWYAICRTHSHPFHPQTSTEHLLYTWVYSGL